MITPFSNITTVKQIIPLLNDNKFIITLCDNLSFLMVNTLKVNNDKLISCHKKDAPILGLYVKIYKFWLGCLETFKKKNLGVHIVYCRILYEAFMKLNYLLTEGDTAMRDFRLKSYRKRYEIYKKTKSNGNGVSFVENQKFSDDIAQDGFSLDEIKEAKKGDKNFKELSMKVSCNSFPKETIDLIYDTSYGISSDAIHSDWGELRQLYLNIDDSDFVTPNIEDYSKNHYRVIIPTATIILQTIKAFISYVNKKEVIIIAGNKILSFVNDIERVFSLISEYVLDEYNSNPDKYMNV